MEGKSSNKLKKLDTCRGDGGAVGCNCKTETCTETAQRLQREGGRAGKVGWILRWCPVPPANEGSRLNPTDAQHPRGLDRESLIHWL